MWYLDSQLYEINQHIVGMQDMYLDTNQPDENRESVRSREMEDPKFTDLFRRDLSAWTWAPIKYSWLIVLFAFLSGSVFFTWRYYVIEKTYVSSCSLMRQEITDVRYSDLPLSYTPFSMDVIFNSILGHNCLRETARRLNLHLTHDQVFSLVSVRKAEKRSNYFFISAIGKTSKQSSELANTLAEVFLDEYKKMIRTSMEEPYRSSEKNLKTLIEEQNALQMRLNMLYLDSLKRRVGDLTERVAETPPEVVTHSEQSSAGDKQLMEARMELERLRQMYTDKNPMVEKQQLLVDKLQREYSKHDKEVLTKVIKGRNPEYVMLSTELSRMKAELESVEKALSGNGEGIASLRIGGDLYNVFTPQMNTIIGQIEMKKDQINKQEAATKKLLSFMNRSYSDISIREPAMPPKNAMPRKVMVYTLVGIVMGAGFGLALGLFFELINLSVRGKVDITEGLHLNYIGEIPILSSDARASYYSSIQEVVSNAKKLLPMERKSPAFIMLAKADHLPFDEVAFHDLLDVLYVKENLTYKVIRNLPEGAISDKSAFLINDVLYGLEDVLPKANEGQPFYFNLNELAFLSPPTAERMARFSSLMSQYQIVIWESFPPADHWQLFTEFADFADLIVIPMEYGKTSKQAVFRIVGRMGKARLPKIAGVLYNVNTKTGYYK